jgi:hypothetical protein
MTLSLRSPLMDTIILARRKYEATGIDALLTSWWELSLEEKQRWIEEVKKDREK